MVASGDIMQLDHAACIAHQIHLILSTVLKKKKRPPEQGRESWKIAVEAEPDAECTEYEGDDELSEADREQMQTLRDDILEEMDTFVSTAVEDVEKDQLAEMRLIVQKFQIWAVFRKSPKAWNRLALLQTDKLRIPKKDVVNPVVDCPTRWNSCYNMLCRFISLEKPIGEFFLCIYQHQIEFADMQNKLTRPKAADWLAIKYLVEILAPFASVSTMLDLPYAPLSSTGA
ncbi:hypothetical protein L914_21813 [Phytophthora nicotianae]|uniref:HAT C-terminal dimerisation domain-containing protein n=2 Tax=Phytophthora nicotianae TaxID=4792 RepID=V9E5G1_PHYNI|nr:hypothetical protein F443_19576 [Phytophthora nicotianae P1569]ETM30510.1 hypothetical protein L914_21813 [Phytophthora nicotianae]